MTPPNNPYDKRAATRVTVNIPADLFLVVKPHNPIKGEIKDISEGGAFIECTSPLKIGDEINVQIVFSETKILQARVIDHEQWLRKTLPEEGAQRSVVRWVKPEPTPGFGIEFVNLQQDKKQFLARLIHYYEQLIRAGVSFSPT